MSIVQPFSRDWLRDLVGLSLTEPRRAATILLDVPLRRNTLWTWLALVSVLNGISYSLTVPAQLQMGVPLPNLVHSPIILTIIMAVLMLLMTQFFVLTGRVMGGASDFGRMLQVTCWLQSLRVLFQAAVTLISMLSNGIAGLVGLVGAFWGVYILVNFVAEAHRFDTPLKAVATLIFGVLGVAFAMTFLLTLFGFAPPEPL